jgi:hypothetical protein
MPFILVLILLIVLISFIETQGILFLTNKLRWSVVPITSLVFLLLWGIITFTSSNYEAWTEILLPFSLVSSGIIIGILIDYSNTNWTSNRENNSDFQFDVLSSIVISIFVAFANFVILVFSAVD